jgi:hypothetical protein
MAGVITQTAEVIPIKTGQIVHWFGLMVECIEAMPADERAVFQKWDSERPEGIRTSDWPGFKTRLPERPF